MNQSISYSAVVLDEKSHQFLVQTFQPLKLEGWTWFAHHMTICMGPITDESTKSAIGTTVTLTVNEVGYSDKVVAVSVNGFNSTNKKPHVTVLVNTAGGGKPVMSNNLTADMWHDITNFTLTGVVTEVPNKAPTVLKEGVSELNSLPFLDDVKNAGGKIYSVGGKVRDQFLGLESKDLDIVIQGVPYDALKVILQQYGKVDLVGASFGVIKFKATGSTEDIDIAITRTERKLGTGHKGFEVNADHTLSIEDDLGRRDLSLNSMAQDLNGEIIDPYNGQEDIKNKIIRVTNPQSFGDDPLRLLRVCQFASRFRFTVEPVTFKLIKDNAHLIKEISGERILLELEKMVVKGSPKIGAQLLVDTGLFEHIFDCKPNMDYDVVEKSTNIAEFIFTMLYKSCVPSDVYMSRLKGELNTYSMLKAFYSASWYGENESNEYIKRGQVSYISKTSAKTLTSFIVTDLFNLGDTIKTMKEKNIPFTISELNINGNDLMNLGFKGAEIGNAQRKVLEAIDKDELINDKNEIIKFLTKK